MGNIQLKWVVKTPCAIQSNVVHKKKYLKIKAQVCVWVCTSVCDCGTDCDGKKTVYTKFEREWKIVYVCICVK